MIHEIILGSQSPRRKEILSFFKIPFRQASPNFDEEAVPFEGDPAVYAQTLARGKALSLKPLFPKALIITADTVVYRQGKLYGKPMDEEHGFKMLSELAGQWHTVYTAVTVSSKGKEYSAVEGTKVLFNALAPEQIRLYQRQLHCADKAGGYMAQAAGSLIINKIEGCYYNVVGLPINTLTALLKEVEIDLWQHLA